MKKAVLKAPLLKNSERQKLQQTKTESYPKQLCCTKWSSCEMGHWHSLYEYQKCVRIVASVIPHHDDQLHFDVTPQVYIYANDHEVRITLIIAFDPAEDPLLTTL